VSKVLLRIAGARASMERKEILLPIWNRASTTFDVDDEEIENDRLRLIFTSSIKT
jgi:predicted RNA polymerase sigma factor